MLGGQVQCLIKASRARFVTLPNLENEYYKKFGHPIPLGRLEVQNVEELVRILHSWVRVVEGKIVTIDQGFIKTMANNVRSLLLEDECGQLELEVFKDKMATRYF